MNKRPKRRRSYDNPYVISFDKVNNKYFVEFRDVHKQSVKVEISSDVYNQFDKYELDDLTELNEYDRHIEHSTLLESTLNKRAFFQPQNIEDSVIDNLFIKDILTELNKLPEIQKRRIKKYYLEDKTLEEIAEEEKCTKRAVKFSIDIGIDKISKKFKN